MNGNPIGIFDSGVGGLTILQKLQKLLPKETYIYVADQKYAPYGKKTKTQVKSRALKITKFLQSKDCKLIIVACNTATIASVDVLRKEINIPIIGVVPVIKTAAGITKTKKIMIFATPSTTKSSYLKELINKFASGITVYKNGATGLESIIETGEIDTLKIDHILMKSLSSVSQNQIDTVVLGCTHYPFLKEKIKNIVGKHVQIIDSGGAVARHAKRVLQKESMLSQEKQKDLYYTTKDKDEFQSVVKILTKKTILAEKITI